MKTQSYLPLSCGPIQSLLPTVLTGLLTLSVGAFGLVILGSLGSLGSLGNASQPSVPAVTIPAATPAPLCFDHSSEFIATHGAPVGCPTDPMAYSPAAAFRVQA